MKLLLGLIFSYVLGSFPTAYIIAKKMKNVDIRHFGSGNVGATNAARLIGYRAGSLVLLIDVLKGLLPATCIAQICSSGLETISPSQVSCLYGLAAFIGHNWSCFLGFKGGKGVATAAGVFLGVIPDAVLIAGGAWIIVVFATRYVSLGSILAAVAIPVLAIILNKPPEIVLISVLISSAVVYRHKSNINRLIHGAENKLRRRS
ncbi:MAG: glycerol-3-phosphate 1-O-acyltransferase PlsY [Candidatus Omnitrophica bacterium]|nr:glycerol-3-phosphate 1-O-acyltransferase PlsY [Candidatus Omnitrophota bacterium]